MVVGGRDTSYSAPYSMVEKGWSYYMWSYGGWPYDLLHREVARDATVFVTGVPAPGALRDLVRGRTAVTQLFLLIYANEPTEVRFRLVEELARNGTGSG